MAYDDAAVTAAELGQFLGLTARSVRNEADAGHLVRAPQKARYLLVASVARYAEHLRLAASRRGDSTTAAGLTAERSRLAKLQADLAALKAATLRGELVPAGEVEAHWRAILTRVRSRVLAVPSRVRATLPHLRRQDAEVLVEEIRGALEDLAQPTQFGG